MRMLGSGKKNPNDDSLGFETGYKRF